MDKKEIREQYKRTPTAMGIYQVKNLASGKIYLGRALDLKGTLNSETFQLKNRMHMTRELQKDFDDLGEGKFAFEVQDRLQPADNPDHEHGQELKEREAIWLDKLQPYGERGYHQRKA